MVDDHVDRPEVYAQQCVQPTGTNRPRAWIDNEVRARYGVLKENLQISVAMAVG